MQPLYNAEIENILCFLYQILKKNVSKFRYLCYDTSHTNKFNGDLIKSEKDTKGMFNLISRNYLTTIAKTKQNRKKGKQGIKQTIKTKVEDR